MIDNQYYTYSDKDGDEIDIRPDKGFASFKMGCDEVIIPQEELPNLIKVLQSYVKEDETNTGPWYVIDPSSDIIGPFSTQSDAVAHPQIPGLKYLVRQIKPPTPVIDYDAADTKAKGMIRDFYDDSIRNLSRAYLALRSQP